MLANRRFRRLGLAAAGTLLAALAASPWDAGAAPGDTDSTFVPITPCRLIDTRPGPARVGPHAAFGVADTKTIQAHGDNGECSLPTEAVGLALNITALDASEAGTFVTVWPDGPLPLAANLNPAPGQPPTPNAVTTQLSSTGSFNVYNERGSLQLVIDVNGYYTASSLRSLDAVVPSGAVMPFAIDECPPGWSEFAAADGRMVVGAVAGDTIGGQVGTPLADVEERLHEHEWSSWDHGTKTWTSGDGQVFVDYNDGIGDDGMGWYPLASFPVLAAGVETYATSASSSALPYVQLLMCVRD